jgi:hypothetical protein
MSRYNDISRFSYNSKSVILVRSDTNLIFMQIGIDEMTSLESHLPRTIQAGSSCMQPEKLQHLLLLGALRYLKFRKGDQIKFRNNDSASPV